jgi:two-component system, chemotaxis family, chemotaxis protein CheY
MKALIVEDDFTNRLLLQSFLSHYGECHIAVNGKEAVAAYQAASQQNQRYDLICMDILMPEMDGREAIRAIRHLEAMANIYGSGAKIFMTSAIDDAKEIVRAFHGLCDAYLVKPIDTRKLLDELKGHNLVQ